MRRLALVIGTTTLAALVVAAAAQVRPPATAHADWPVYRGDPGGNQYAPLAQIHAANVHRLVPAWTYRTGDASTRSTMHVNPIVVDGVMYITTPTLKAVALDAATGQERWVFDPAAHRDDGAVIRLRNRGVAYWRHAAGDRVFHFAKDRMFALDARTGAVVRSFGRDGFVDLREHLGLPVDDVSLEMTSPGAVFEDLVIVGSRVNETYGASPGHVRAYSAETGALVWLFRTIPDKGEFGYDTWTEGERHGGANAWGGVTIDERRGWAFVATGSATDDFYGGLRQGQNLFANSVVALDARTGQRKWHYQTIHHDIWDYDNPPAPILVTLRGGGERRDAVVQLTKMGLVFVLDRETGEPIFPVQERPVPASSVEGEAAWPTQPVPSMPPPLVRQTMTESDLVHTSPDNHRQVLQAFRRYVSGQMYTPPSLQGTITTPGHLGGSQWHGGAFDPATNVLFVNVNEAPTLNRLRPVYQGQPSESLGAHALGQQVYAGACGACHGADRGGVPPHTPALTATALSAEAIEQVVQQGRNGMPAFPHIRGRELSALTEYLRTPTEMAPAGNVPPATRYTVDGYEVFSDPTGVPAIAPPWGTLNAVHLTEGRILWKVPLGEYPHLAALGMRNTGTTNFGGTVATAGGVVFVAATADEKFRAFESTTGRVLWEHQLPAGGYATPSVYMVDGRQYVAIAAGGGGKNATRSGDAVVSFAVEDDDPPTVGGASDDGWLSLFDGKTLEGWAHLNGMHTYTVEDGVIVGRTAERSASTNSFLVTRRQFGDFELELETMVDRVTNQGIQIRSRVRPTAVDGRSNESFAGRVFGPQVEVRRTYKGLPTTGMLYGEALGTGWLSSAATIERGHTHFIDEGWNKVRIVARGPRIQTWVNGHLVEDLVLEDLYKTHPSGFVGLQIHGLSRREIDAAGVPAAGLTTAQPMVSRWRNIRLRPFENGRP